MSTTWKFYCTQCGNRTVADVLGTATETEWLSFNEDEPDEGCPNHTYYSIVKCTTCAVVQLYTYHESHEDGLNDAELLYPKERSIAQDVPAIIAREFAEAKKVEKISKAAYAVLIGRVLERLFQDQGAAGKDMYEQIKDLSHRNIIPEPLCKMGHTLRFLRNKGAHATDYDIEEDEVQAMKDFIITLLEYVYVAPAKLAALTATIEKKKERIAQSKSKDV